MTERKYTALYRLKAPVPISLVIALLANGLDPSAAVVREGCHAAMIHDQFFRRLSCAYRQLDKLVA